jgi:hypothetical protein
MRGIGTVIIFAFLTFSAFAQLPNKVKKMEGTWEYKYRSGFEVLDVVGEELVGVGYRINPKTNDTTKVENIRIRMANKNLIYSMTTQNVVKDSVILSTLQFVGEGKRLKFQNISSPTPYMIKYSFGFLNKNKLFIRIYPGPDAKPIKLILTRKD